MATERPLSFWITLLERLLEEQVAALLDEHGVTRRQWLLMDLMSERPVPRGEVDPEGEALLVELVDSGWVTHEGDGYALTERGGVAHRGLRDAVDRAAESLTDGIPPGERDAAAGALERMARNLGWTG